MRTSESRALQAEEAAHAKAEGFQRTATSDSEAFGLSSWPAGVAVPEIWKELQGQAWGEYQESAQEMLGLRCLLLLDIQVGVLSSQWMSASKGGRSSWEFLQPRGWSECRQRQTRPSDAEIGEEEPTPETGWPQKAEKPGKVLSWKTDRKHCEEEGDQLARGC